MLPHLPPALHHPLALIAHSSLTTLASLLFLRQDNLPSKFKAFELAFPSAQDVSPPDIPVSHSSTSFKCQRGLPWPLIWSSSPHHTLLFSVLMFLQNTHYHISSYYLFIFPHQYLHDKVPQEQFSVFCSSQFMKQGTFYLMTKRKDTQWMPHQKK